jgi:hypothetical protein
VSRAWNFVFSADGSKTRDGQVRHFYAWSRIVKRDAALPAHRLEQSVR